MAAIFGFGQIVTSNSDTTNTKRWRSNETQTLATPNLINQLSNQLIFATFTYLGRLPALLLVCHRWKKITEDELFYLRLNVFPYPNPKTVKMQLQTPQVEGHSITNQFPNIFKIPAPHTFRTSKSKRILFSDDHHIHDKKDHHLIMFFKLVAKQVAEQVKQANERANLPQSELTTFLKELRKLKVIEPIKSKQATSIRAWMQKYHIQLSHVTSLKLTKQKLERLPPEIQFFTGLQSLDLSYNCLRVLPPEIGCLTNLSTLLIKENELDSLPIEIGSLSKLQILDISENNLTDLPSSMVKLTLLRELNFGYNQFEVFPIVITRMTRLTDLILNDNLITVIPAEIGYLGNLSILDLRYNLIESLPNFIKFLTKLEFLFLSKNKLTTLPSSIQLLVNLKELILDHNLIEVLPNAFTNLRTLEKINLRGNILVELPASFIHLALTLNFIDLRDNHRLGSDKINNIFFNSDPNIDFVNLETFYTDYVESDGKIEDRKKEFEEDSLEPNVVVEEE